MLFLRQFGYFVFFVALSASGVQKESHADIIEKAQNLSLQQERDQALSLLKRAYLNEPSKKNQTEILKSMDQLATIFYTEKGQSLYEQGRAIFRTFPAEARAKFLAAAELETKNILVLLETARVDLFLGKCEDALSSLKVALEVHPYFSDLNLAKAQAQVCLQNTDEALLTLKKVDQSVYSFLVYTQIYLFKGDLKQVEAYLNLAKISDPKFPEIFLWEIQIRKKSGASYENLVRSYVKACKELTPRQERAHQKEPRVCLEYKNIESEFKNQIEAENKKEN